MLEPRLELEIIWKDVYMMELAVSASNGCYCGMTEVYTTGENLTGFANALPGFPKTKEQTLQFELGEQGGYAYFAMKLYRIDAQGHTATRITLEKNNVTDRPEEKDKVALEMLFEPASLDEFGKQLLVMGLNENGKAVLKGYMRRDVRGEYPGSITH